FSAQNRMSGVDLQDNTKIRKGAFDAIRAYISEMNGKIPSDLETKVMEISNLGGTPLVVCKNEKILEELKTMTSDKVLEVYAKMK
ncbi:hypothetical protein PO77_06035, partial [Vibrio parahaemolyticus]